MISEATEMSNPVALVMPFSWGPCPMVIPRRKRSLVSSTRRQVIVAGSMSSRTNLQGRGLGGGGVEEGSKLVYRRSRRGRCPAPHTCKGGLGGGNGLGGRLEERKCRGRGFCPAAQTRWKVEVSRGRGGGQMVGPGGGGSGTASRGADPGHALGRGGSRRQPPQLYHSRARLSALSCTPGCTHLLRSSAVSSLGSAFSMPSLRSRRSITAAKCLLPSCMGGSVQATASQVLCIAPCGHTQACLAPRRLRGARGQLRRA